MTDYFSILEILHKCSFIFDKMNYDSNSITKNKDNERWIIYYRDETNIEFRRERENACWSYIVLDLFNLPHDEQIISLNLFHDTLSINFDIIKNMYQEYVTNGEISTILIYGREILNLPKNIIDNLKSMLEVFELFLCKESSC